MPQHDYVIDNQAGAGFRSDVNNALAAIVANNSGTTEPATMYAHMWWADTTANILKRRNAGNTAWISVMSLSLVISTFAETLLDDADAATARATLGFKRGSDIASAATINLTTATGDIVDVTGTTAITAITLADGESRTVRFTGILTLTNGASLVLPGGANITTAAGDFAVFRGYASSVVRCTSYQPARGVPVITKSYDSGDQVITAGGGLTLAHGMAALPKIIETWLHCTTAELGYSVDDYVKVGGGVEFDGTNSKGVRITPTTAGFTIRFASSTSTFTVANATTGVAGGIANANWRLVIKAYA